MFIEVQRDPHAERWVDRGHPLSLPKFMSNHIEIYKPCGIIDRLRVSDGMQVSSMSTK
jgi:hypothetical protein